MIEICDEGLQFNCDILEAICHHSWQDEIGRDVEIDSYPVVFSNASLLKECDLAVVRFGDKYKQWNTAFEAGQCAAMGKAYITLHSPELIHALKEVDAAALAVTETPEEVVEILRYVIRDELAR